MVTHVYIPNYLEGRERIAVWGQPMQKHGTQCKKQTNAKSAGGMAQVLVLLPIKCEALYHPVPPPKN
jgi:hypothetical protein